MTLAQDRALDSYNLPALNTALAGTPFAGNLHHFTQIDSTNAHAMQQGTAGAPHGSVYLADAQTAGRGRGTHTWVSPLASGLYISILLRPPLAPGDALWCSLAAGLAVLTAIQKTTSLTPDLRWPNDILIGRRKLAGILTEMHAEATRVRHLVIGIGINVHQPNFPPELAPSATSIAIEGAHSTRGALLVALLHALDQEISALTSSDPSQSQQSLVTRLETASTWIHGKSVIVDEGQGGAPSTFAGLTAGLDQRGFLQVQTEYGMRTVLSGGVREA